MTQIRATHRTQARCRRRKRLLRNRRGIALYIMVLFTALAVSMLGLAGISIMRVESARSQQLQQINQGQALARSAIELGLHTINGDPNWRKTYDKLELCAPIPFGTNGATIQWAVTDSDGSIKNADVELRVIGVANLGTTVTQTASLEFTSPASSPDALKTGAFSGTEITTSNNVSASVGPAVTNGTLLNQTTLVADVLATQINNAGTITGTTGLLTTPLRLLNSDAYEFYLPESHTIDYSVIPSGTIENCIISGLNNPFGSMNTKQVYQIQVPPGQTLEIRNCRIVGLLLIELGSGAQFRTSGTVIWEPPSLHNYPALIAKSFDSASIELKSSTALLSEAALNLNLNNILLPYNGNGDFDKTDDYAAAFKGLYHVIGGGITTTVTTNFNLTGCIATEGPLNLQDNVSITANPDLYNSPPDGYEEHLLAVPVAGTWRRE